MVFLISLVAVCIFTAALRRPLAEHPSAFYVVAMLMVGLFLYAHFFSVPIWLWRYFLIAVQRCSVALAFFALVMFAPILPSGSRLSAWLYQLRRQLAILGSIFAVGHVVIYAQAFLPRIIDPGAPVALNLALSLVVALAVSALLVVLAVTSFTAVHQMMRQERWKRVQMLAYPFFVLLYAHLVLVHGKALLLDSPSAVVNLSIYTALFGVYVVFSIRRFLHWRRTRTMERLAG
jgi:DMSO/TMAO reductase YedYZ heme-binding membrane subunit